MGCLGNGLTGSHKTGGGVMFFFNEIVKATVKAGNGKGNGNRNGNSKGW